MTSPATGSEPRRAGSGTWSERIPLILLLLLLWSIVVIWIGNLYLQSIRSQFDLGSGATLKLLFYLLIFGAAAVATTFYVRAKFR